MAIPKVIYQTFKTHKIPFINKLAIRWLKYNNPAYEYQFYDDERILTFLKSEFDETVLSCYNKLNIGAAKADFFRYAILYKKGGIYLDIDAYVINKLDKIINDDDVAVISRESFPNIFVQWALIFAPEHPFLKKTLDVIIENIKTNAYPNSVHGMTGPTAFSKAILSVLEEIPTVKYRVFGQDYNKKIKPRLPFAKWLYKNDLHWKKMEKITPVLK